MPYVKRKANGLIDALFCEKQPDAEEEISSYSPEVLEFLKIQTNDNVPREFLVKTDVELVRVVEDLINLLVDKGVILLTELPHEAQRKIVTRRCARHKICGDDNYSIIEDEEIQF